MAKEKTVVSEKASIQAESHENNNHDGSIGRVYLQKKTGLEILERPDAEADIKGIRQASNDDDSPYIFYEEDGEPVYMAIKNQGYKPLVFPEPGPEPKPGTELVPEARKQKMGMTSMELYSIAVTLPQEIAKIIELETEPKPSLIDQAKKIMTPTIVIVACVVAIFLIVAMMKG